jgi:YesN/AraC family two-component response regulator
MPRRSGFDLAKQVQSVRPDIPIVMTSGYIRSEHQEKARAIGIQELILKPDTIEELRRALDRLLSKIPARISTAALNLRELRGNLGR